MKCPVCSVWTRVLSTREGTVRRRECANLHRFTTDEALVPGSLQRETQPGLSDEMRLALDSADYKQRMGQWPREL